MFETMIHCTPRACMAYSQACCTGLLLRPGMIASRSRVSAPLSSNGREDLWRLAAKAAKGEIDAPAQDALFRREVVFGAARRPLVAEHALDDLGRELAMQCDFLEGFDAPVANHLGPGFEQAEVVRWNRLRL